MARLGRFLGVWKRFCVILIDFYSILERCGNDFGRFFNVFCKYGDVVTRADNIDTTTEFIKVMANSGFEYAQKASMDLKSKRLSDQPFKETILQNASCDNIQNIKEL